MSDDIKLKKQIVWINKEDLTPKRYWDKLYEIDTIKKFYGICYVLSKDLTKKELERLFGGFDKK